MEPLTKVLFIDDEKHIRQANKQTLELAGLEVTTLESAEQVSDILEKDWPGIVASQCTGHLSR